MSNPNAIIAEFLGAVCAFEHKIQQLKQSLSGHPGFDPRCMFSFFNRQTMSNITASNISSKLSHGFPTTLKENVPLFVNKYGSFGKMTYEEFLDFISPQNNKSLKESLLLRNSETIEPYLVQKFQNLLNVTLVMLVETEKMKKSLIYEHDLNLQDVHQRVRQFISNERGVIQFLKINNIEIDQNTVKYLRNYDGRKKPLGQAEIRNMFTPITQSKQNQRSSSIMRRGFSQGILETTSKVSLNDTKTKADFLKIKYQPKTNMFSTIVAEKMMRSETCKNMNNSFEVNQNRVQNKQNAQLQFQISQSVVKSLTNDFLPMQTKPPTPQYSIPLLELFGKSSKAQYKQQNKKYYKGDMTTYNILEHFSRNAFLQPIPKQNTFLTKSKVKFEDDLSFVSESAFKFY